MPVPEITARSAMLTEVALQLIGLTKSHPFRVGIDGVDGAGKTTFADELTTFIQKYDRPVVRASVDGFHNPRDLRYRLGKSSPEGFYRDSYNYEELKSVLLNPLGPDGSLSIRTAHFDHRTDLPIVTPAEQVSVNSILLFDGIFLQRPELRSHWDLVIFLDASFEVTCARMALRDGSDPNVDAPSNRRYVEGQRIYLRECNPKEKADIVIDNCRPTHPRIVKMQVPM